MTLSRLSMAAVAVTGAGLIVLCGTLISSPRVHADDNNQGQGQDQDLVSIGLFIAPVKLNFTGKDPNLIGLGSYIVNAQGDCNGCHTSSPPPGLEYGTTPTSNNPYLLFPNQPPWRVQAQYYLGGGQNFGPAGPGVSSGVYDSIMFGPGLGPNIITRNLTPDHTGLPEGGHTLQQFLTIMQTGHDYDKLHLNCSSSITTNCYDYPVNGAVLQVMPWPIFSNMTVNQLTAIWTYLSAIPCIANTGSPYTNLINECGP